VALRSALASASVYLAACQVLGDLQVKTLVSAAGDGGPLLDGSRDARLGDAADGTADVAAASDAAGPAPLPADCHTLDPRYDEALWPVPPDGPDGTNYQVDATHGTVLDLTTKLMWQAATAPYATYDDAKCACRALTLGGFDNWRMPSLLELVTIVDYAKNNDPNGTGTTVPTTNSTVFPETDLAIYWSATAQGKGTGLPFLLDFSEGNTVDADSRVDAGPDAGVSGKDVFRCVRSTVAPPPPPRYDTSRPDAVVDLYTRLEWQKTVASVVDTPAAAAGYCQSQQLDGHQDWRLPTVKELASLFDFTQYPAFDPLAFPNAPSLEYVTATVYGADPTQSVWTASGSGDLYIIPSSNANSVRCVRSP